MAKVVHVLDQSIPYVSGYSMRSKYITDSLRRLGIRVDVYTSPAFSYSSQKQGFDDINYFRSNFKGWDFFKKLPLARDLAVVASIRRTLLKNWKDDYSLVHAHSSPLMGVAGLSVARHKNVPFVYEIRALWEDAAVSSGKTKENSFRYNLTKRLETSIARNANRIFVICNGLKSEIVSRGIESNKISVVPNGVDLKQFKRLPKDSDTMKHLGLMGEKVIGFIGSLFRFEGLNVLIESIPFIIKVEPSTRFIIVGGGEMEGLIRSLVTEKNLCKYVFFAGRVAHKDIAKYYSIMDILVYPRLSERITEMVTPLKPLEAMAIGKLVIGSGVGGIKELIRDGKTGLIFEPGNPGDLASKCLYALSNRNEVEHLATQGLEYVTNERNWLNICNEYVCRYAELGVR